mmetsp:Transcript_9660/g.29336  ORF Transcript_9660/g.29336 Transcript_9660/m.29336 type:complete len:257 (+) Transcript_9660:114-884(+)
MVCAFTIAFEVLNSLGEPIRGTLDDRRVNTSPASQSNDAVVLCHGFRSSRQSSTLTAVAERLSLPAVRFDFSGNGESGGEFQYGNYSKEVEDLRSIVQWVRTRGLHVKGILGHSKGGNVVLLYGAKYDDVDRIVNVCGRFDLRNGVEERIGKHNLKTLESEGKVVVDNYVVTLAGLRERMATDMSIVQSIRNAKVMHVHGSEDEVSPVSESKEMKRRMKDSTLVIIEGADHRFSRHHEQLAQAVVPFLEGHSSEPP